MKISRLQTNQFQKTGYVKKQKEEPDRVILGNTNNEVPDFISQGKLLAQKAGAKESSTKEKVISGAIFAVIGGGMAGVLTMPLRFGGAGLLANVITAGGAVAGGVLGAMIGNGGGGDSSGDSSIRSMQTTVGIATNNIGLI